MMTTTAALLGAPALCFCFGEGSEPRQPLGVSAVGRLIFDQALTLYTIPIVYLYLNRPRLRISHGAELNGATLKGRRRHWARKW